MLAGMMLVLLTPAPPSRAPSRADAQSPPECEGLLEALKFQARALGASPGAVAVVTSLPQARVVLAGIATDTSGEYSTTAKGAAANAIKQIDICLAAQNAPAAAPAGGNQPPNPAPNQPAPVNPLPNTNSGQPASGGSGLTVPPIAPLSDQRTPPANPAPGGPQNPAPPGGSPILEGDVQGLGGTVAANPKFSYLRLIKALGLPPPPGVGIGVRSTPTAGTTIDFQDPVTKQFRPMLTGERVDGPLRITGGPVTLDIEGTPLEVVPGRNGVLITPTGEVKELPNPFTKHRRDQIDVPVPSYQIEGDAQISLWAAIKGAFQGALFTVTVPKQAADAGVKAGLDLAIYLRGSDSDTGAALQSLTHVYPNSSLLVRPAAKGNDLFVTGKVEVVTPPPKPVAPLGEARLEAMYEAALGYKPTVRTPLADIEHRETAFSVEHSDDGRGRTTVNVSEGSVTLRDVRTGKEQIIGAGQSGTVQDASGSEGNSATSLLAAAAVALVVLASAGGFALYRRRMATP